MELSDIEDKIAKQEMTAAQVFTQMKQHISIPVNAPIDNGIPELDNLCGQFNRGEISLSQLVCTVWNTANSQKHITTSYKTPPK